MDFHTPYLPDEPHMTADDINRILAELIGFLKKRSDVSDPDEISIAAVSHVLLEAQTPGKVKDFRKVVFRHAIREARREKKYQARLMSGDDALAVADAARNDCKRNVPLATVLAMEKIHILSEALRELSPTHRRTVLWWMSGKTLRDLATEDSIHSNTPGNRKKAAFKKLNQKLTSYIED